MKIILKKNDTDSEMVEVRDTLNTLYAVAHIDLFEGDIAGYLVVDDETIEVELRVNKIL